MKHAAINISTLNYTKIYETGADPKFFVMHMQAFYGHFEKNSRLKNLRQIFKKLKHIIQKLNNLPTKN